MKPYLGLAVFLATLSVASIGQASASGSPSFYVTSNCTDGIYPLTCGPVVVTVTSLNGFSGTVNLTTAVTYGCTNCSLTATVNPTSVNLSSGGNATSKLQLGWSCHHYPNCQWLVTITGTSGILTNSTDVYVCVGRFCVP